MTSMAADDGFCEFWPIACRGEPRLLHARKSKRRNIPESGNPPPKPDQPDWKSTQAENHSIMKYTAPDQTMEWVSDL